MGFLISEKTPTSNICGGFVICLIFWFVVLCSRTEVKGPKEALMVTTVVTLKRLNLNVKMSRGGVLHRQSPFNLLHSNFINNVIKYEGFKAI